MNWRRVFAIIGAVELAVLAYAGSEVLSFVADPLPTIVTAVSSLLPSLDLLNWLY